MESILQAVRLERRRQDWKWGEQNHTPQEWLGILLEEVGEVARAINEAHFAAGDWADYERELVEAIAVGVAMLECLHRNGPPARRPVWDPAKSQQRDEAAEQLALLPAPPLAEQLPLGALTGGPE